MEKIKETLNNFSNYLDDTLDPSIGGVYSLVDRTTGTNWAANPTNDDQILGLLLQLKGCFLDSLRLYKEQFVVSKMGFFERVTNSVTAKVQGVSEQEKGVGKLISDLHNLASDAPHLLIREFIDILNHSDIADDSNVGGKSICRYLVQVIYEKPQLVAGLDLSFSKSEYGDKQVHCSVFERYFPEDVIAAGNISLLRNDDKWRVTFRKFYRDYLRELLKQWEVNLPAHKRGAQLQS